MLVRAAGLFVGVGPGPPDRASIAVAQDYVIRSTHHDYRVVTVVDGLVKPWSMAFLPGATCWSPSALGGSASSAMARCFPIPSPAFLRC